MDRIRPCPYCGGSASLDFLGHPSMDYTMVCSKCGKRGRKGEHPEDALYEWNEMVEHTIVPPVVEGRTMVRKEPPVYTYMPEFKGPEFLKAVREGEGLLADIEKMLRDGLKFAEKPDKRLTGLSFTYALDEKEEEKKMATPKKRKKVKGERTDVLRRRPDVVRYFYLGLGPDNLHTGCSFGGLEYTMKRDGIVRLFLSDLVTGACKEIPESVTKFMEKWRVHYNDPSWDYFGELEA